MTPPGRPGMVRTTASSTQGDYSFAALSAGEYEVSVEVQGFQRIIRRASADTGATTATDFTLRIGDVNESITVDAATPQMKFDSYSVGGLITANEIRDLPLNGRSFLELAKLEPGVQPLSTGVNNRTFVPVLGASGGTSGRGTRVTIDGGSIMALSAGGAAMSFSQEVVQEFQISSVNFDVSTGLTFSGAVNVVTRSGGNDLHGSAFYFFRDHKLSAYPALNRSSANPDPFFQRRQFGVGLSGPIRRDRMFFFANWERNEQRGVGDTTLAGPDFSHFSRITPSPLFANQLSLRWDGRLSSTHTAFLRYSHDGSSVFGPVTGLPNTSPNSYPSNWTRQEVWGDQSILGVVSAIHPTLVNDFRFSYFFLTVTSLAAEERDCPGCLGIGAPTVTVPQAGLVIGQSTTSINPGRRFQWTDSLAWQHGARRARFGLDWEYNRGGLLTWANEPVTMTLFSPDQVRTYNRLPQTPADRRILLPDAFNTLNDLLRLPLQGMTIGFGDPRVPQENGSTVRTWYTGRLYFQDTWRLDERLTLNYGMGWNLDRYKNYDLAKPPLLAPLLGTSGLGPTRKQWKNFSPALGLAWSPFPSGKTVIHAGTGLFYDFFFQQQIIDGERALLGRPGLGRQTISGSAVANPLSDIPGVPVGSPINFAGSPTLFTGADLIGVLPSIRAGLVRNLASSDPTVQAIQIIKQAPGGLDPVNLPPWSAQHINLGVQREIVRDFVLNADLVYRHFIHGGMGLGGIDLNHFNSVRGPVITKCTGAQQTDPRAICSTGPIFVWQAASNQTYKGLLFRADKRFSHGFQVLGSYAVSRNTGTAGTGGNTASGSNGPGFNLDNWQENPGPLITDYSHIANVAGVVRMPWKSELGFNFSYSSAPPFSPIVGGIDFNGDGTTGDLLRGTTVGSFNRGLGTADLARLVSQFNQTYGGTTDTHGRAIPRVALPARYSLDHGFQSLDLRWSRALLFGERWRLSLIGEVFNLYNAANLTGYSNDLTSAAFGQPTARNTQLFGSGGPRAFQLAMRVSF